MKRFLLLNVGSKKYRIQIKSDFLRNIIRPLFDNCELSNYKFSFRSKKRRKKKK